MDKKDNKIEKLDETKVAKKVDEKKEEKFDAFLGKLILNAPISFFKTKQAINKNNLIGLNH
jgi:hypothetical protein